MLHDAVFYVLGVLFVDVVKELRERNVIEVSLDRADDEHQQSEQQSGRAQPYLRQAEENESDQGH